MQMVYNIWKVRQITRLQGKEFDWECDLPRKQIILLICQNKIINDVGNIYKKQKIK